MKADSVFLEEIKRTQLHVQTMQFNFFFYIRNDTHSLSVLLFLEY